MRVRSHRRWARSRGRTCVRRAGPPALPLGPRSFPAGPLPAGPSDAGAPRDMFSVSPSFPHSLRLFCGRRTVRAGNSLLRTGEPRAAPRRPRCFSRGVAAGYRHSVPERGGIGAWSACVPRAATSRFLVVGTWKTHARRLPDARYLGPAVCTLPAARCPQCPRGLATDDWEPRLLPVHPPLPPAATHSFSASAGFSPNPRTTQIPQCPSLSAPSR